MLLVREALVAGPLARRERRQQGRKSLRADIERREDEHHLTSVGRERGGPRAPIRSRGGVQNQPCTQATRKLGCTSPPGKTTHSATAPTPKRANTRTPPFRGRPVVLL